MSDAPLAAKGRASGAPIGDRSTAPPVWRKPSLHQAHAMLTPETLPEVQRALADAGVDGWLLYDFRGLNPIARDLMQLDGMTTRRVFAFIPTLGTPVALTHAIEQGPWHHWPSKWGREIYASWRSLESLLMKHVTGKRVAMEYSAGGA